ERRLLLDADDPPELYVSCPVGLLRVDYRDVELDRAHGTQHLAGERADDLLDRRSLCGEVATRIAAEDGERKPRGPRCIAVRHSGMAVLLQLERLRPAALDRVTKPVETPYARVAAPREDETARAAHPDQLVVDDVRRHA